MIVAAESAFLELANLYEELLPILARYGFKPQSAGVVSRDVSEKIEEHIILHCKTFTHGTRFSDSSRHGERWEVTICKSKGLTINQNARINGENYIVINYSNSSTLTRVWILWQAENRFFTPRKRNLNLRTIILDVALPNVETTLELAPDRRSLRGQPAGRLRKPLSMAKAQLTSKARRKKTSA